MKETCTDIDIPEANFLHWHRYYVWAYEVALRDECGYKGYQPVSDNLFRPLGCLLTKSSTGTGPSIRTRLFRLSSMEMLTAWVVTARQSRIKGTRSAWQVSWCHLEREVDVLRQDPLQSERASPKHVFSSTNNIPA